MGTAFRAEFAQVRVRGMLCGSPQKLATQPVVVPSSILTQVQRP